MRGQIGEASWVPVGSRRYSAARETARQPGDLVHARFFQPEMLAERIAPVTRISFALERRSCGFEADATGAHGASRWRTWNGSEKANRCSSTGRSSGMRRDYSSE